MAVCSDEKEEEEGYEKEEVGEDGEIILVSGDKVSGPWNKSGAAPVPAAAAPPPVGEQTDFNTRVLRRQELVVGMITPLVIKYTPVGFSTHAM